jgi:hypothetical protein
MTDRDRQSPGRCQILKLLGMGIIACVLVTCFEREVAIKLIPAQFFPLTHNYTKSAHEVFFRSNYSPYHPI